jgi:hypothetical protein
MTYNKEIVRQHVIITSISKSIPLLGSGGTSFEGNENNMEANEAQYHAHL